MKARHMIVVDDLSECQDGGRNESPLSQSESQLAQIIRFACPPSQSSGMIQFAIPILLAHSRSRKVKSALCWA